MWPSDPRGLCDMLEHVFPHVPEKREESQQKLSLVCNVWQAASENEAITYDNAKACENGRDFALKLAPSILALSTGFSSAGIKGVQFVALAGQLWDCERFHSKQETMWRLCTESSPERCLCEKLLEESSNHLVSGLEDHSGRSGWQYDFDGRKDYGGLSYPRGLLNHTSKILKLRNMQPEPWTKFVLRTSLAANERHVPDTAYIDEQQAWGKQMSLTADNLAVWMRSQSIDIKAVLDEVARRRLEIATSLKENKLQGASGQVRNDNSLRFWTPIHLNYYVAWHSSLKRRAERFEGDPWHVPFKVQPTAVDQIRVCGVVDSFVTMTWKRCEQSAQHVPPEQRERFLREQGIFRAEHLGISSPPKSKECTVLLNHGVSRSILDGLILGHDCSVTAYQSGPYAGRSRLYGEWSHAQPHAMQLVMNTLLQDNWHAFQKLRQKMHLLSRERILPALSKVKVRLARIYWLIEHTLPWYRGNPTSALLLHHAAWMSVHPRALSCFPHLREDCNPSVETLCACDLDDFVGSAYWTLFQNGSEGILYCIAKLVSEIPPEEPAEL